MKYKPFTIKIIFKQHQDEENRNFLKKTQTHSFLKNHQNYQQTEKFIKINQFNNYKMELGIKARGQEKAKELASQVSKSPNHSTFVLFCLITATLNMDSGIVPASLSKIQQEIQISFQEQGALGALVYLGICLGSLTVTPILQQFSASSALSNFLIIYFLFALLFSFSYDLYLLYICRLAMGFSRSFFSIYGPV